MSVLVAEFSVIAASAFRLLPSINRLVNSYSNFSFNIGPALSLMESISKLKIQPKNEDHIYQGDNVERFSTNIIDLDNISFVYPSLNRPILRNIIVAFKMGQRIGIVGDSGSGKSTLIEILAGLYTPTTGAVLADGRPISEDLRSWQAGIGYVPQVPFVMPGTIRENIAFGSSDSSTDDDEVWSALEKVGLIAFVSSLPDGIETEIGERGAGLSGGQKQLLCIARALFRKPKILLLDEPTASLDIKNEEIVLRAIENLSPDAMIVMVSHKQHNFRDFDFIYVCEQGRLRLKKHSEGRQVVQQST